MLKIILFSYLQKLTWWGWGFRFCRHISGKHQNGLYKTKNIAFEQEKIRPTKSKHPTPLLLGHKAKEAPTKSKSFKFAWYIPAPKVWFKCTLKIIPGKKCILQGKPCLGFKNHQNSLMHFVATPVSQNLFGCTSLFFAASFSHDFIPANLRIFF